MTDQMSGTESSQAGGPEGADPVRELLRLAGARRPVSAERAARVRAAVANEWRRARAQGRPGHRAVRWPLLALAATLAVAVGAAWWARRPAPTSAQAEGPAVVERVRGAATVRAAAAQEAETLTAGRRLTPGVLVSTAADGRLALRLAAGQSLRLDRDTRVVLLAGAAVRLERGAVYVDSVGTGAAVTVQTPMGAVREMGTQFEVRWSRDALRVRVRDGAVALERPAGREIAAASTEMTVDGAGEIRRRWVDPAGDDWRWVLEVAPVFHFDGRSLTELATWVARETGRPLRWADPDTARRAADVRLHGSLGDLRPDEALAAVLPTTRFRHHVEDGELWIAETAGR